MKVCPKKLLFGELQKRPFHGIKKKWRDLIVYDFYGVIEDDSVRMRSLGKTLQATDLYRWFCRRAGSIWLANQGPLEPSFICCCHRLEMGQYHDASMYRNA